MAVTYYFTDPRNVQGSTTSMRDENSMLDYWFYPNGVYMDDVRRENAKVQEENDKKDKGGKGGGGGGSGEGGGKKKEKEPDNKKEKEPDNKKEKPDNKPKNIELKVNLCCEACVRKMQKKLEKLEGVEKGVFCDMYLGKVIVKATTKPEIVLKQAQRVKKDAVMWPQKKKEPEKKDDKKKDGKQKDGKEKDDKEKDDEDED